MAQQNTNDLISVADHLLSQCTGLLNELSDENLQSESKLSPGSTIGKHLRHLYDHYRLLCDSVEHANSTSTELIPLNYDVRSRDIAMETSVEQSKRQVATLKERINGLSSDVYDQKIRLQATTPYKCVMDTTVGRELWFCSLHAIHHQATIRIIALQELKLKLDKTFGFAPSTVVHKQENKAKSKL